LGHPADARRTGEIACVKVPTAELLRAAIFHTPRNPFREEPALEAHLDGGLLIEDGRVRACGDFAEVRAAHPQAPLRDLRGGFLLPGFVDAHVHFPQVRVLGSLGLSLLDWLEQCALPEEARLADVSYARRIAREFIRALASHGTTAALVFVAHFSAATAALFEEAGTAGLRVISGLVVSDRMLLAELHQTPDAAYRESADLIARYHGRGRLGYAVTPRFALSASEAMLEVCGALLREHSSIRFQTHLNENLEEIVEVRRNFEWAGDYLGVYERFGLVGARSVFAHSVHSSDEELLRLAVGGSSVAHCPSSNAALGSGHFPLLRHVQAGVRVALGSDVGAGTGFGILKEGLQAYLMQRLAPQGFPLTPAHLLYLATRAGADALGMGGEIGDFSVGKAADCVYLRPPAPSPLASIAAGAGDASHVLGAVFALAGLESVREVRVAGDVVYESHDD
jgi:guanine deaminase